jgi:hypothetical protein
MDILSHSFKTENIRVMSSTLKVAGSFVATLREESGNARNEFASLCMPLFNEINQQFNKSTAVAEIKSHSIISMAHLVKTFHVEIGAKLTAIM